MAVSVTISENTKAHLERLQAEIRLRTGQQVSQQAILARVVETAIESEAAIVEPFRTDRVPVSDAERAAFHQGMVGSDGETTEADIDDVLY